MEAIRRMEAAPEDIIVSLDGDDWFASENSLAVILDAYRKYNCWITYGSWIPDRQVEGESPGMWKAYPEGTTDFRNHEWLATAVRTWKKWLWDRLKDSDLRDDRGEYFRIAEDRAIMLPLLEMAGDRARHIAEPIMIYNRVSSDSHQVSEEAMLVVETIAKRNPYQRIVNP